MDANDALALGVIEAPILANGRVMVSLNGTRGHDAIKWAPRAATSAATAGMVGDGAIRHVRGLPVPKNSTFRRTCFRRCNYQGNGRARIPALEDPALQETVVKN